MIEHFFDPIGALEEWRRIAREFIYIICPQPTALEADRSKSITPLRELKLRHLGIVKPPDFDNHQHYTRWTSDTFVRMCRYCGFNVVDVQDPDDKVGNGFAIVINVAPSLNGRVKCWWSKQQMRVGQWAFERLARQNSHEATTD
jgi:hypothetical protein